MGQKHQIIISGMEDGQRLESRVLEARIQEAVSRHYDSIEVQAHGQHGIGGRLWQNKDHPVEISVTGPSGQRLGSFGFPGTRITVHGQASDDVGWLNAGANITVLGDATNGACNGMAQGRVYVAGDIGARGMTMTKHNPRFAPPELWVLGGAGDSFAEFMAGGVAVVCGLGSRYRNNILGHRPCVGMVGGRILFRGAHRGYSEADARLSPINDADWQWLTAGLEKFLTAIGEEDKLPLLTEREQWQMLRALTPQEKREAPRRSMSAFRREVWDAELGRGGVVGDLTTLDRSQIEVITTGKLRRRVPEWANERRLPPCQFHCPTGIPVQKRWELIRQGRYTEAIDLILHYTPFAATVCGHLCPNVCMEHCTRGGAHLRTLDVSGLGRASLEAAEPEPAPPTGRRIAIIGGGPAGLSLAWQLYLKGHTPVVFDRTERVGGKIKSVIPGSRIPEEVIEHELGRIREHVEIEALDITVEDFVRIREAYDYTVIATGAQVPRVIPVDGREHLIPALDFLREAKNGAPEVGKKVVIIGAGNVGCDVATEAARLGAEDITLIDVQEPASFGKEREAAEAAGARFVWPAMTRRVCAEGVELDDGTMMAADTVIISVGDQPGTDFVPDDIEKNRGFISVDEQHQTSDPRVFAIGDTVRPGLLTDAIGAGRLAARVMDDRIRGREDSYDNLPMVDTERINLAYYDPRARLEGDLAACAGQCASCGQCRDCGMCEAICPQDAISRRELGNGAYEYVVDEERCIGCGFCAGACPCGVWEMMDNEPLE